MHMLWGSLMMAAGLFMLVCASLKSAFIVYRLLCARSRSMWVPVCPKRVSGDGPDEVVLESESFQRIPVSGTAWEYEATNLLVAPGKGLVGRYRVPD